MLLTHVLLIISFILHVISLLAIVVLFQRRSVERLNLPSLEQDVETLHDSMEAFVTEIEKENEILYERIEAILTKKEVEWQYKADELTKNISSLQEKVDHYQNKLDAYEQSETYLENAITADHIPPDQLIAPVHRTIQNEIGHDFSSLSDIEENLSSQAESKEQRALTLYEQGFTADQIAKILNIGKGETALIINMHKKSSK